MLRLYALLGVLALVLGLGAWGYKGSYDAAKARGEVKSLTAQRDAVADALRASEAERKRIASVSRELTSRLKAQAVLVAAQKKALNEALKASPDWAAAPVPDRVWDALGVTNTDAPQSRPGVDGTGGRAPAAGSVQR